MSIKKNLIKLFGFILLSMQGLIVQAEIEDRISVFAVNYPLAYFAERIGGEHIELYYPIPRGIDPAFWKPSIDEIIKIQQLDLILLNGAEYAKWLGKVSLPYSKLVDTSKSFNQDYIHIQKSATHQHGPKGEHSHAGIAFTTWLDFSQADAQAKAVMQSLSKQLPAAKQQFESNFQSLSRDLNNLNQELKQIVTSNQAVLASHPVYQYLARRYHINLLSVMWEPDAFPSEAEWSEFKGLADSHGAGWMIWEDEPDQQIRDRLKGMNIQAVVFSPCMNRPEEGDFISVMQQNIENIAAVFR